MGLEMLLRYRWYLIASCTLFFLARWSFLQGKLERLADLPADELIALHDSTLYFRSRPAVAPPPQTNLIRTSLAGNQRVFVPSPLTVKSMPIQGGLKRVRGLDTRPDQAYTWPTVTGEGICYLSYSHDRAVLLPAKMFLPRMSRRADGRLTFIEARLHCFPFNRKEPERLKPELTMHVVAHPWLSLPPYTMQHNSVYWLEANVDKKLLPCDGRYDKDHLLIEAPLKLMRLGLSGGKPETIAAGLPKETRLYGANDTVWWMVPSRNGLGPDLFRLRSAETKPEHVLHDADTYDFPVEFKDRLYWRRDRTTRFDFLPNSPASEDFSSEIVSATVNGANPQIVYTDEASPFRIYLFAHQKRLYVLQAEYMDERTSNSQIRNVLYSFEEGAPARLRRLVALPRNTTLYRFDGNAVYFIVTEARENIFDWSKEGLSPEYVPVLYRYRLPAE